MMTEVHTNFRFSIHMEVNVYRKQGFFIHIDPNENKL